LPVLAAYHITKAIPFGAKKLKSDIKELKDAIDKCGEIGDLFEHFTTNEWIFDNKKAMAMYFNNPLLTDLDLKLFNIDVTRINWKMYIMNFAYGLKRFILKEEAELPSVGYNDVITLMSNKQGDNFIPFYNRGRELKLRPIEELKRLILDSDDVKDAIAKVVRERTEMYKHYYQLLPNEDKIYKEVNKEAIKMIERIMSNYNHRLARYFA